MKKTTLFKIVLTSLLLAGCSPSSLEDYQSEGESRCRELVGELEKIENVEQLLASEPKLKKYFEKLVDLMIEAREYQKKHTDELPSEPIVQLSSDQLKEELRRIYQIEGGREIVERAQQEALIRLDADKHRGSVTYKKS